jgi:hypothetical protein
MTTRQTQMHKAELLLSVLLSLFFIQNGAAQTAGRWRSGRATFYGKAEAVRHSQGGAIAFVPLSSAQATAAVTS